MEIGSWKYFVFVIVCVCVSLSFCKSSSQSLQMISFKKIYGLYGLEHHTVKINGGKEKEMSPWRRTNKQTDEQVNIELLS